MASKYDYEKYFPFDVIRDEQRQAIEFTLDAFYQNNKRFVIAELGTGTGKSAIAITVARYIENNRISGGYADGSYLLTTQKVLQEQYITDFGKNGRNILRSIKSAGNFTCNHYSQQNCGESRRLLRQLKGKIKDSKFEETCNLNCPYVIQRKEFIDAHLSITNFSFFLTTTMFAPPIEYDGKITPRQLLVIDEGHNIESELGKFSEVTFSEKFAKEVLKCKLPVVSGDEEKRACIVFDWIKNVYNKNLLKQKKSLEKVLETRMTSDMAGFGELSKQYQMLDSHTNKVTQFLNTFNSENWIMNVIDPVEGKKAGRKYEFKPVDISSYGETMLYSYGDKVLILSATIVDKDVFCRSVGIKKEDVSFMRLPSPFPIENRPIHIMSVGKMSMDNIQATLPKMLQVVEMILNEHKNEKGIIHTSNYKIAQYIVENIKSNRILTHNSENREQVLTQHIECSEPTVLLSPSMMEGVDLANDASRFQILCKLPFPYLGDKVVKKRKSKDPFWYPYQTVKSIIQAMGRSVRNKDDYAISYILDADWDYFYSKNKNFFPVDFQQSIQ